MLLRIYDAAIAQRLVGTQHIKADTCRNHASCSCRNQPLTLNSAFLTPQVSSPLFSIALTNPSATDTDHGCRLALTCSSSFSSLFPILCAQRSDTMPSRDAFLVRSYGRPSSLEGLVWKESSYIGEELATQET